ncbi:zinc-binding dehydrogenase [Kitasatospora sp. NPDC054768]
MRAKGIEDFSGPEILRVLELPEPQTRPSEARIRVRPVMVTDAITDTERLDALRRQAEAGALTLHVADVLPAEEAARAHRPLEAGGLRGRLVLDFS